MFVDNVLISVIVPIYNVEKYILNCLQSIQKQTYTNLEVILIDDGSKDKSGEIAKKFILNDSRFRYIYKANGGLSSARNEGLKNVHGQFVFFLDSDDWIKDDYLDKLIRQFDDETDIVIGKYTLDDQILGKCYVPFKSEQINREFSGAEKEKEVLERLINSYPSYGYLIKDTLMPVWKNMYRYSLIDDNKILFVNERDVGAEDYVFNCYAYYFARKIRFSSAEGYVHVIVPGSLSRSFHDDMIDKGLYREKIIEKFIENRTFYNKANMIEALDNEKLRVIIGGIYQISTQNNSLKKLQFILKNKEIQTIIKNIKKPNIDKKYVLISYALKTFGVRITYFILKIMSKVYILYRLSEYRSRV